MVSNVLKSTLFNKCPKCHQGKVFEKNNPYLLKNMFDLHRTCSHCGLKFEREPGYFTGAMYVAYALTSGWFILWFVLYLTVIDLSAAQLAVFMIGSLMLLAPLTLRWSRMLWLNMDNKFDEGAGKK